jgi:hypothetical protein
MRLYIKLFFLVLMTVSIQKFALTEEPSELWFGLRCEYAYVTNNAAMIESLVGEAQNYDFYPPPPPIIVNATG